jgi:hypothetical protein
MGFARCQRRPFFSTKVWPEWQTEDGMEAAVKMLMKMSHAFDLRCFIVIHNHSQLLKF